MIQAPIFSFLEGKVQKRFNDATRAQVERKLKLEQAKRKEVSKKKKKKEFTCQRRSPNWGRVSQLEGRWWRVRALPDPDQEGIPTMDVPHEIQPAPQSEREALQLS